MKSLKDDGLLACEVFTYNLKERKVNTLFCQVLHVFS